MAYDSATWHQNEHSDAGLVCVGMFLGWAIKRNLVSSFLLDDARSAADIKAVKNKQMLPSEFCLRYCDGMITEEEFSEEGQAFAAAYYDKLYLDDLAQLFPHTLHSSAIPDTWENFNKTAKVIDGRYKEWKKEEKRKAYARIYAEQKPQRDRLFLRRFRGLCILAFLVSALLAYIGFVGVEGGHLDPFWPDKIGTFVAVISSTALGIFGLLVSRKKSTVANGAREVRIAALGIIIINAVHLVTMIVTSSIAIMFPAFTIFIALSILLNAQAIPPKEISINSPRSSSRRKQQARPASTEPLPSFKYQPYCYQNGVFVSVTAEEGAFSCPYCGRVAAYYYPLNLYAEDEISEMCPHCIADGSLAQTYSGTFIQEAEPVSDECKTVELLQRTPGYESWQGEYWLACCDDYCAFIGRVGWAELQEMGIEDEVLRNYEDSNSSYSATSIREHLNKDDSMVGYLFKCLDCGKYRLWVDAC